MRLIRKKLDTDVARYLAKQTVNFSLDDPGIAEDLFCLFRTKGSGLPTDERLGQIADEISKATKASKVLTTIHLKKRRQMLREVTESTYFKSLCLSEAKTPHRAVQRLFTTIRTFSRKRRQASCMTCSLRTGCAFGQQYGDKVTNIAHVVDPNLYLKVDPNCPDKPEIDSFNELAAEMNKLNNLNAGTTEGIAAAAGTTGGGAYLESEEKASAEFDSDPEFAEEDDGADLEDEDDSDTIEDDGLDHEEDDVRLSGGGGASHGEDIRLSFTGRGFAAVNEKFVNNLSSASLQLFELGRVLDGLLAKELKGKFAPVEHHADEKKTKPLTTLSELAQVNLAEHAVPEVLDAKIGKGEVNVVKHAKPTEAKSLLYVLIDCSGSMSTMTCDGNPHMLLTRAQTAASFAAALCLRVTKDGGLLRFRYFSTYPLNMLHAASAEEGKTVARMIANCNMWGGGTSIDNALVQAVKDIEEETKRGALLAKAEVLLISDMDDSVDDKVLAKFGDGKKAPRLSVLDINASKRKYGNAHSKLKAAATKYFCVSPSGLDLNKLVDLAK